MFITFRREYLDQSLFGQVSLMKGRVLDIGGKKEAKRGRFRPPLQQVKSWEYLNLDASTKPDFLCSAESIPVDENSFDTVLLCEVLEHLENPENVLKEAFRVLKNEGSAIVTMPFLYPIHGDPNDFQRWTPSKLQQEFKQAGFSKFEIQPMGGGVAVIYDLLVSMLKRSKKPRSLLKRVINFMLVHPPLLPLLKYIDKKMTSVNEYITTGYLCILNK